MFKGYFIMPLDIPISPRYLIELGRIYSPTIQHGVKQSHTLQTAFALLQNPELKDLHRTPFEFSGEKVLAGENLSNNLNGVLDFIDNKSKMVNLNLTSAEIKVLLAFAFSVDREYVQGGVFRGLNAFLLPWLMGLGYIPTGAQSDMHDATVVSRSSLDSNVLLTQNGQTVKSVYGGDREFATRGLNDDPYLTYQFNTRIVNKNGEFVAELDKEHFTFQVDSTAWRDYLLPKAEVNLNSKEFKSEFYNLIPFLMDVKFTELFAKKLSEQNDPALVERANYLIGVAFDGRPKDIQRIAGVLNAHKIHTDLDAIGELNHACKLYTDHLEKKMMSDLQKMRDIYELFAKKTVRNTTPGLQEMTLTNLLKASPKEIFAYMADHPAFLGYLENKGVGVNDSKFTAALNSLRINFNKYQAIQEMNTHSLKATGFANNKEMINAFAKDFGTKKPIFAKGADSTEMRLLKRIGHILASLTIVYGVGMAIYSSKTRGSAKFWKSNEEVLQEKAEKAQQAVEDKTPKKQR